MKRRTFIRNAAITTGAFYSIPMSLTYGNISELSIQEVIDKIIKEAVGEPLSQTVDTVKTGDASQLCTGIVTTFLANTRVIEKAAELNANLIVTHEPTFYNHLDEKEWLGDDPVLKAKEELLAKHGIVVWRFHDYWHRVRPDGVLQGIVNQIGWSRYWNDPNNIFFTIPKTTLRQLCNELGPKFMSERASYIGNGDMEVTKVAIIAGAAGKDWQIDTLQRDDVEVLIVGEIAEWETSEYVRDASALGMKKGLIVLGHQPSEEPGMVYAAEWLGDLFPGIQVTHVNSRDGFKSAKR